MAEPYLGEIRTFGFNFAPVGWALCNGQLLSISQNPALFSLLGTFYGGNGTSNFQLPDLQAQCAVCMGSNSFGTYELGESAGATTQSLTTAELPSHTHAAAASSSAGTLVSPVNNYPAATTAHPYVGAPSGSVTMVSSPTGGGLAHPNQSPYLVATFCIAIEGIFPSRN
jgi:microcystin-dependent protein